MQSLNIETILAILLVVSELLAMIPSLKSNGIFQLIVNILKRLGANTSGVVAAPPASTFPLPNGGIGTPDGGSIISK